MTLNKGVSGRVVLDSSVWVEIFGGGSKSKRCESERAQAREIVVPTLVLFEVYRTIAKQVSDDAALSAVGVLSQATVADLTREIALTAADLSLELKMATADSLVLAHAVVLDAVLVTLDNDFAGVPGARVIR